MFLSSWLRNRKAPSLRVRRKNRFRPWFEPLEGRAVPATFNVTTPLDVVDANDGMLSLREAILAANSSNGADTIVVPAGTYTLLLAGADEDGALTGDLDLADHVTIKGAGAGATVIDAAGLDRVFHILFDANVSLSGMTIRGGIIDTWGGGIFKEGTLTIEDSVVSGNSAWLGGGIFSHWMFNRVTLTVRNSTISDNFADTGGGIYGNGNITVHDSTISGNTALFLGGGIVSTERLTLENSIVANNSAALAGGIYLGLRASGVFQPSTISGSTITGNSAGSGGGILNDGTLIVNNSTLSDNFADAGGGIYNSGTLRVLDSTILGNFAVLGGDVYNAGLLFVHASVIGDRYDA
jgi:hypothetical protein